MSTGALRKRRGVFEQGSVFRGEGRPVEAVFLAVHGKGELGLTIALHRIKQRCFPPMNYTQALLLLTRIQFVTPSFL